MRAFWTSSEVQVMNSAIAVPQMAKRASLATPTRCHMHTKVSRAKMVRVRFDIAQNGMPTWVRPRNEPSRIIQNQGMRRAAPLVAGEPW